VAPLRSIDSLPPDVQAWARGFFPRPDNIVIEQLSGGVNNIVFAVSDSDTRVVVKTYPQATDPAQDRYKAEYEILSFANKVAPSFVPKLLSAHAQSRFLVMEHLDGVRFTKSEDIHQQHVEHAAAFIRALNADRAAAAKNISVSAADGFYTLSEHAENVAGRIAELTTGHLPFEYRSDAQSLVDDVKRNWVDISAKLENAIRNGGVKDELELGQGCVSPSDYGLHNALLTPMGLKFFDFEFAGWDDPTKLYVDFFLQPRIRVPVAYEPIFQKAVTGLLPIDVLRLRAACLRPVLQLKWVTIVLGVLRPQRFDAMLRVTVETDTGKLIKERLSTARSLLSQGIVHGLH
jgi:hypothetical protein